MLMLMLMLILIQKRNINVIFIVIFSLYVFLFFFSAFIHFLISSTRRFFSSFVYPHSKKTKQTHVNFSSFESLIRPLSHQHHSAIYTFYNHESPSFTNQQKKKINKKNKNHRHLVSKTSFNLLVIHVQILRSITTCAENDYHFTPENTFTLQHTLTPQFTPRPLQQMLLIEGKDLQAILMHAAKVS